MVIMYSLVIFRTQLLCGLYTELVINQRFNRNIHVHQDLIIFVFHFQFFISTVSDCPWHTCSVFCHSCKQTIRRGGGGGAVINSVETQLPSCITVYHHFLYSAMDNNHAAMLTKLQKMNEQLDTIENTAKKLEGDFKDSNQVVCNMPQYYVRM